MLTRFLTALLLPLLTVSLAFGNPGLALPDLGSNSMRLLAGDEENDIGRAIMNELRRNNLVLEDPEVTEYLQHLGSRLVAGTDTGQTSFTFFIVKDDSINAFALPGGYIGIHSGLFLRTQTESELASVVAHEIAHVTQHHIARRFDAAAGMNLKGLAILLGAIALAATGSSGKNVTGAMMLGQGLMLQEQINFTRTQEYEADRVGVGILERGGFNPQGMVDFFETMQRIQRLQNTRVPEFLSTHPLSLSRVSEATQRVRAMERADNYAESRSYALMKARLGVLADTDPIALAELSESNDDKTARYARALDLLQDGEADTAAEILYELRAEDESVAYFHVALGRALLEAGRMRDALSVFDHASAIFPGDMPLGLAYAEALRRNDEPGKAFDLLRNIFNRNSTEPEHVRSLAQVAMNAGARAESHYYMAEYYLRTGDFGSAREQLQLARAQSDPGSNQHLKYKARLDEVNAALLEMRRDDPRRRPRGRDR